MLLRDRFQQLPLRKPSISTSAVAAVLSRCGAEPWFRYAFQEWRQRWHVWRGVLWTVQNLPRGIQVLETGCGCGWNLFWLAANGFTSLIGIDNDAAAIAVGNELAVTSGYPVHLSEDDALNPRQLSDGSSALILALNWTYHVPEFDLALFLQRYRMVLAVGGMILIDTIDRSFDNHPDSKYLTSDWGKPAMERRPSEYIHRFTIHDIRRIAGSCGYQVLTNYNRRGEIPRSLYVLRRG